MTRTTYELPTDELEQPGNGKQVAEVRVALEDNTFHPTLGKRVVAVETQDGAVYRFQRFSRDEPLVFYNRENPDGEKFERDGRLPENVNEVVAQLEEFENVPDVDELEQRHDQAAEREHLAVGVAREVMADGGLQQTQNDERDVQSAVDPDDCDHPVSRSVGDERRRCIFCGQVDV